MRMVSVPYDAVVLVLTPKQARQFSDWYDIVQAHTLVAPTLPNSLIQKIKAVRP